MLFKRTIYDDDHDIFRKQARRFFQTEVVPHHDQWEKDGVVSREVWKQAGRTGLLCTTQAEQWGGAGADFKYASIVVEEQIYAGTSGPGFSLHSDIAVPYIEHHATDAMKKKWLPGCASGEVITAIAMTEPAAGSDLQGIRTTAVRDGDEYVINGSKTFITNGQLADLIVVVAKTDPDAGARGTSLFLVEGDREGLSRGRNLEKLGMKAQDTSELFFEDVRVPAENLLGMENAGFIYLMQELPQERLSIAVIAAAAASAVLQETVNYVKERQAFGRSIAKFQNTRFKLAEMAEKVHSTQIFVDHCVELHCKGQLSVPQAALAKSHSTEVQFEVIDTCLQLHGGYGYMWEYPVARAWADSRVQRIYGGTTEIMREIVSRAMLDG